jgi:hypothetical protein
MYVFSGSVGSAMGANIGPVTGRVGTSFALTRPERDQRIDAMVHESIEVVFREIDSQGRIVLEIVAHSRSLDYTDNNEFRYEVRIERNAILMRQFAVSE